MPNAWQDYAALIFAFYNRSSINIGQLKQNKCFTRASWVE